MAALGRPSSAEAGVQLREPLLQRGDIFRICRLKLTQVFLIDVRDFSRLDGLEEPGQPISLLVPIFSAHNNLDTICAHGSAIVISSEARKDCIIIGDVLNQHRNRVFLRHSVGRL